MDPAPQPKPFQRPHLRPLNLNRKLPALPTTQSETAAQPPPPPGLRPPSPPPIDALLARVTALEAAAERKDAQVRQLQQQAEEARGQAAEAQRRLAQVQRQLTRLEAQARQPSGAVDFEVLAKSAEQECRFVFGKDPLDLGRIERNIDILNRVAADGPLVVWPDGPAGVARLRPARPVELHFHRNGVRVADGNDPQGNGGLPRFLLYSSGAGQAFVSDLLQGFLPAEFQTAYPGGVQLHLLDRSREVYASGLPPGKPPVGTLALATRDRRHSHPDAASPLEPLPEPGGEAPARPAPAAARSGSPPGPGRDVDPRPKRPAYRPTEVPPARPLPPAPALLYQELDCAPPGADPPCRLKLRSRTHTLLVRAGPQMTVASLRAAVAPTLRLDADDFELCAVGRGALPLPCTLAAAGLVPNGTLFVQLNRG